MAGRVTYTATVTLVGGNTDHNFSAILRVKTSIDNIVRQSEARSFTIAPSASYALTVGPTLDLGQPVGTLIKGDVEFNRVLPSPSTDIVLPRPAFTDTPIPTVVGAASVGGSLFVVGAQGGGRRSVAYLQHLGRKALAMMGFSPILRIPAADIVGDGFVLHGRFEIAY